MSEDVLVRVENVSKRFCRSLKRSLWYGLQDLGSELRGRRHGGGAGLPQSSADVQLRKDEFWAVKDVSFELRRGECLGLIGRNGAGKTTLLRMLNGLIKPDTGRIEMRGRVGALIALGAGFNPVLTGRENILINSSVLGLPASEAKRILPEIQEFSEIGDLLDSPVSSYSSGMVVRLGFAAAIYAFKPEILILDEVLAVGDEAFRSKCLLAVSSLLSESAAIFVSHSMPDIARVSSLALWISEGKTECIGDTSMVAHKYTESLSRTEANPATVSREDIASNFWIEPHTTKLRRGDDLAFTISFNYKAASGNASVMIGVIHNEALVAQSCAKLDIVAGHNSVRLYLRNLRLNAGSYTANINLLSADGRLHIARTNSAFRFSITSQEDMFISAASTRYSPVLTAFHHQ